MFNFLSLCTTRKKPENNSEKIENQSTATPDEDEEVSKYKPLFKKKGQKYKDDKDKILENKTNSPTSIETAESPKKILSFKLNSSSDDSNDDDLNNDNLSKKEKLYLNVHSLIDSHNKKDQHIFLRKKKNRKWANQAKVYSHKEWIKILAVNDINNTSISELSNSLKAGIPDDLRPDIWSFITSINDLMKKHTPDIYYKLIKCESISDKDIERDIYRTYPTDPYFSDLKNRAPERLYNILRAYSNYDKEIGYTQGANFIVGTLLIILNPDNYPEEKFVSIYNYEELAFWYLIYITHKKNWRQIFKSGTPKVIGMSMYFESELKRRVRDVYDLIMQYEELTISSCFDQMMITLLTYNTPLEICKRILDIFFLEGDSVLFKIVIKAIELCHEEIMILSSAEQINNFFRSKLFKTVADKYQENLDELFRF